MCRCFAAPQGSLTVPRPSQASRSCLSVRVAASHGAPSVQQTVRETSNILPTRPPTEAQRVGRRQELELQAKALLEQDNSWHRGEAPPNVVEAHSPQQFKQLITGAGADQLVIVDYFAPHCSGCRTLYPKLKQIAANNEDCLFIKVNTDSSDEVRELAMNLGVTKLPFFQLWRGADIRASFTANVSTVSALRAEIATHKACTDPGCDL